MTPQVPPSKTTPALVFVAALAGLQLIAQGTALGDIVPPKVVALIGLILAGVQLAANIVLRGQVTPWSDVAAKIGTNGQLVAGPAAPSTVPGEVVDVTGSLGVPAAGKYETDYRDG